MDPTFSRDLTFGLLVTLAGILLPWRCYGDLIYKCSSGISFSGDIFETYAWVRTSDAVVAMIAALVLAGAVSYFLAAWMNDPAPLALYLIAAILYIALEVSLIEVNGGLFPLVAVISIFWLDRSKRFSTNSKQTGTLVIAGALFAYSLFILLLSFGISAATTAYFGSSDMRIGVPIMFAGALITLLVSLTHINIPQKRGS